MHAFLLLCHLQNKFLLNFPSVFPVLLGLKIAVLDLLKLANCIFNGQFLT